MGKTVIATQDLSLTYQTADGVVEALSKINLTIEEGEFVSLIGPSGCGKTTLLRAIANLETPSSGTLLVNGMGAEQALRALALWRFTMRCLPPLAQRALWNPIPLWRGTLPMVSLRLA